MGSRMNHVVVGVVPGQPDAVVRTAARFAASLGADLVCACVDPTRYAIETLPDGTVLTLPIDPDQGDEAAEVVDPELHAALAAALDDAGVRWSVRALAGGPAQELSRLAEELDAAMIVVGTREPGLLGSMREFFSGSVAAQLTHRQHRPVLVVPLDPVGPDAALPWEGGEA